MRSASVLTFLAAQLTTLEKIQRLPMQVWINVGICVLAVVLIVRTWRTLKKFNDYAPWFGAMLAASFIMFYWVYERTEPKFLTPIVDRMAYFLPTKSKQEADLEKMRRSREADR